MLKLYDQRIAENEFGELFVNVHENGSIEANGNMELRDERVSFFVRRLARGKHSLSYRLRAEIPGRFSALPTKASCASQNSG